MSQQRGLTWSGKWHVVDPGHPDARRYAMSRCGTYLYRDDDPRYPEHLRRIKDGVKKSSGVCKKCARIVGVKAVTVELPEPTAEGRDNDGGSWAEYNNNVALLLPSGRILTGGLVLTPSEAKVQAAALLAAADAAEAR